MLDGCLPKNVQEPMTMHVSLSVVVFFGCLFVLGFFFFLGGVVHKTKSIWTPDH